MIGRLLRFRARRRLRRLARIGVDPGPQQERLLLKLVRRAAGTRFGREHGFDSIRGAADFRERVPVQDYASMLPRFLRARDGAPDECWPGKPVAFAMTSGTSGGSKYLPQTGSSVRSSIAGALDALSAYLVRARDRRLPRARVAILGGCMELRRFDSGIVRGDNSGIMAAHLPRWLQRVCVPSPAVLRLSDWEAKLEASARELVRRNVRVLVGAPSWLLTLIDRVEEIAGRPIRDVWPHWRGLIHGGVAFPPYADHYRRRVGDGVIFVDTYAAPQGGILAVQDRNDDPAMIVVPDRNVYYEFVPAEDPTAPRVGLEDVVKGMRYLVHVSTDAGLWAHRIGDVVRFTATHPARLLVVGRHDALLNAFGENVSQEELEGAVASAAKLCDCAVREFTVVPEYPRAGRACGRHLFLAEFAVPPPDLDMFARAIDLAIQSGNDDYRTHRVGDVQLLPPFVRLLPRNTFFEWMKSQGRLGGRNKVPRVLDAERARDLMAVAGRR